MIRRRSMTVYEKPEAARLILARSLGISTDEAALAIAALIEGGYGVAPRLPTNGMLAAYLEALTPPTGHEQVITAISKARLRWTAMLEQGTAMAMSRKALPASVDTLPKGQDAKQGLAGTEGSAVDGVGNADGSETPDLSSSSQSLSNGDE